MHTTLVMQAT